MPRQSGSTSAHTCKEESKNTDSSAVIFLQHGWKHQSSSTTTQTGNLPCHAAKSIFLQWRVLNSLPNMDSDAIRIQDHGFGDGCWSRLKSQLQRGYMESQKTLTRPLRFECRKKFVHPVHCSCSFGALIKRDLLMLVAEKLADIQSFKYLPHFI